MMLKQISINILITSMLLFVVQMTTAQSNINYLLKDSSITWVCEVNRIYSIDYEENNDYYNRTKHNDVCTLKQLETLTSDGAYMPLIDMLDYCAEEIAAANSLREQKSQTVFFTDSTLVKPISFEVESDSELTRDTSKDVRHYYAHYIVMKQIIYYDTKKSQFEVSTHSIGIGELRDGSIRVAYWLKLKSVPANTNFSTNDYIIGRRLTIKKAVDLDSVKVLKNTKKQGVLQQLAQASNDTSKIFYTGENSNYGGIKYNLNSRRGHYINGKPKRYIMNKSDEPLGNIRYLGLVEDLYWNDKLKEFHIKLRAVSPYRCLKKENAHECKIEEYPVFFRFTDEP